MPVILCHEYPPSGGGGIAEHVSRLAKSLGATNTGISVHVITNDPQMRGQYREGLTTVHRISSWISGNNFLNWALVLNAEFVREVSSLNRSYRVGLLHVHDWMSIPAAITTKIAHGIPFVVTIHSTERRRCGGIHNEYSQAIESLEEQGIRESARVITNDEETREELIAEFGTTAVKIKTVPPEGQEWAREISSLYYGVVGEVSRHL